MKRSRDTIISHILDICANGASKTRIVYQANLNFRTALPYEDAQGMVEYVSQRFARCCQRDCGPALLIRNRYFPGGYDQKCRSDIST